ncbi:MAG: septum site-determining protein MinD [Eubacteriales bacterium]|nr:septum site-determining protein MinD [Eubacteriales bacterium]
MIASGKGGVGKTTAAAHLATELGAAGYRTALVDADCGLRNLDAVLGLENHVVYDLLDVAEGNCTLRQALVGDARRPNVQLLAAPRIQGSRDIAPSQMKDLVRRLRDSVDFVLLDCPAGVEQGFDNAAVAADFALLVVTGDVTSVRDARRATQLLAEKSIDSALLINRYHKRMARSGSIMPPEDIAEILSLPVWALIPDEAHVVRAGNLGMPLPRRSKARAAYAEAARRMLDANPTIRTET